VISERESVCFYPGDRIFFFLSGNFVTSIKTRKHKSKAGQRSTKTVLPLFVFFFGLSLDTTLFFVGGYPPNIRQTLPKRREAPDRFFGPGAKVLANLVDFSFFVFWTLPCPLFFSFSLVWLGSQPQIGLEFSPTFGEERLGILVRD
jgi:fucose 4-O-acetylase-like acetyltransferase